MTIPERDPKIAVIIAAYNESPHIRRVLDVLSQVDILNEILVVDDGSRDATQIVTAQAAEQDHRIRLITHSTNLGKGQAIFTGLANSQANILLLLDADLFALKPEHVVALVQPVLGDESDMTLGLFKGGHWNTDLSHRVTPWLSGQRCLRSDLMEYISRSASQGYGLETAITVAAILNDWRIQRVRLDGVSHPAGERHRGFLRGLANRVRMYAHILRAGFLAGGASALWLVARRGKQGVKKNTVDKSFP